MLVNLHAGCGYDTIGNFFYQANSCGFGYGYSRDGNDSLGRRYGLQSMILEV